MSCELTACQALGIDLPRRFWPNPSFPVGALVTNQSCGWRACRFHQCGLAGRVRGYGTPGDPHRITVGGHYSGGKGGEAHYENGQNRDCHAELHLRGASKYLVDEDETDLDAHHSAGCCGHHGLGRDELTSCAIGNHEVLPRSKARSTDRGPEMRQARELGGRTPRGGLRHRGHLA